MRNPQIRILVAEDERSVAEVMRLTLSRQGWQVDIAGDGLEAVAQALAEQYDLILMDHRMPRCSGMEAARRIRAARPEQRMAMVTGSPTDEALDQIAENERFYHLNKPFTPEELVETVRGWLEE